MRLKSSLGVRRFINRLISWINCFLPYNEERMEWVPFKPFLKVPELEAIVWEYYAIIDAKYGEWHDGEGVEGERYKQLEARVQEIEKKYGARLDKYLEPYGTSRTVPVAESEGHRSYVEMHRHLDRRQQ